jgi:hypothetical protein
MLDWFFGKPPNTPRPSIVDVLARFNRPWALRWFGTLNACAAVFYGAIATYGLLAKMFPRLIPPSGGDFLISDMVALMERSATHTALAGLAFAISFVTQAAAIVTARNDTPSAPTPGKSNDQK